MERLDQIRDWFEGRQAMYLEEEALLVRVSNIRPHHLHRGVTEADVEELPCPGLPVYSPRYIPPGPSHPLRWKIGIGVQSLFTPNYWSGRVGQCGGWCLHFSPQLIAEVLENASRFPEDQSPHAGFIRIRRYIEKQAADAIKASLRKAGPREN
jgi:hypothetical protein